MTVRKCSTCKYYEPAPIWRKGWCRNPLLYSPQQSHLVGEDDLDCDRGMGNYWEPIDGTESRIDQHSDAGGREAEVTAPVLVSPVQFAGLRRRAGSSGDGGDDMGQYPPSGTRRPFGDDEDDDFSPRGRSGDTGRLGDPGGPVGGGPGGGGPGGPERQFNYNPDERYWTDYVRIALPVIGVILLLGLAWFWINNLIGGNSSSTPTATSVAGNLPPIVVSPTASPRAVQGTPARVTGTQTASASATPANGGTLKNGAAATVSGTGGTGVNMRSKPTTSGSVVTKLAEGTKVTITGDSVKADGYTWWPVKAGDQSGYVVQDYLKAGP